MEEVFADPSVGRSLSFQYERVRESLGSVVTGPLGLRIDYGYDQWANLISVTRDERVEYYKYSIDHPLDRHNLVTYTDPNGNRTRYVYYSSDERSPVRISAIRCRKASTNGSKRYTKRISSLSRLRRRSFMT